VVQFLGPIIVHVHRFTHAGASFFTVEYQSYHRLIRAHATVQHGINEWARDADGDDVREVHCNTTEGLWNQVRNCLRPFKGVHKKYLVTHLVVGELYRNQKCISPAPISSLVTHTFYR
jgi:hypothetical protein